MLKGWLERFFEARRERFWTVDYPESLYEMGASHWFAQYMVGAGLREALEERRQ